MADTGKKDDEKPVQRAVADTAKKDEEKPLQKKPAHAILDQDAKKDEEKLQTKTEAGGGESALATVGVPAGVEAQITSMSSGGDALSPADRSFYEGRFGYSFGDVRLHSGAAAAHATSALNARAFTFGQHIFFGHGEYRPQTVEGRRLMAHELTHTVQQSAPAARTARRIQRGLLDSGKDWVLGKIRQYAADMPGYRLLTIVLGRDPITDQEVAPSAENIVHGVLDFVPDGEDIFQNLQESKTITQFADYFNQQVQQFNLTWPIIKGLFRQAWDALDFTDIADPSGAWEKIKAIFGPPLERLKNFAINVGGYILSAIKKKVLQWLKDWATKMKGYSLLTFILGKDPFTDEPVERTPTAFVHAVLDLVPGGDKIYEDLERSKTIEKTVDWLNEQITKLDLSWEKIKELFRRAWDVISLSDLLHPLAFVDKIRDIFGAPVLRVLDFAVAVGKKVLEFIFEGVMMLAGPLGRRIAAIFTKASAAFSKIVADPVAFLGHLLDAAKLGFKQFVAKIGEYLEAGVIAWLTGSLANAGIVLPKVWDLKGILSLVLQILGITYAKIRAKVVKALGENGEKIVSTAEKVWSFLVALVTEGPAAAWQKITEALGNFWDLVIGGIKNWAIVKIIKTAVAQLVMLFNPVGAVVEAIVETYRTIEFFIKRINQILDLVEAIVDSIANIAAGQIAAAANYVEKTLGRTVPVIIGFLASLVGLDDVTDGIRDTIEALQAKVDEGLEIAINWIVKQVRALFGKGDQDKPHDEKWDAAVAGVKEDINKMPEVTKDLLEAAIPSWKEQYKFSDLKVTISDGGDSYEIDGSMSPGQEVAKGHIGPLPTGETDSDKDAIPIRWFKPATFYEPITLEVDKKTEQYSPRVDKELKRPSARFDMPETVTLGINGKNFPSIGKKIKRIPSPERQTEGQFKRVLASYGFDWSGVAPDHVQDLAWSGDDEFNNLWPLDSDKNSQANEVYYQDVTFAKKGGKEAVTANLNSPDLSEKWFKIKSIRS